MEYSIHESNHTYTVYWVMGVTETERGNTKQCMGNYNHNWNSSGQLKASKNVFCQNIRTPLNGRKKEEELKRVERKSCGLWSVCV